MTAPHNETGPAQGAAAGLVRGATRGQALDNLINLPAGLRKNFSVQVLDSNGNPVKTSSFANTQPIRRPVEGHRLNGRVHRGMVSVYTASMSQVCLNDRCLATGLTTDLSGQSEDPLSGSRSRSRTHP